jgi:hypothetical protein
MDQRNKIGDNDHKSEQLIATNGNRRWVQNGSEWI